MQTRLACCAAFAALVIACSGSALAQYGYDANCRPLSPPGYMMLPQPQSQACVQQRAQAARAAEAERQRLAAQAAAEAAAQQERAAAEAKASRERLAAAQAECQSASAEDVKATIDQDPVIFGRRVTVLDVTAPHYDRDACRAEAMTSRGIIDAVVTFQQFNGKQYIRVRYFPHLGSE
jgi:hypothetical protein